MKTGKEFVIQFVGLSLGEHIFEYTIDDSFFKKIEHPTEIKQSNIHVKIRLHKQSTMMVLHFEIYGTLSINCDRCTEEFDLPIKGTYQLIVKIGGHDTGDDDDIITISNQESELDIAQYIFEYITLSLPIRRVHPDNEQGESTCDKEMLKKLKLFLIKEQPKDDLNPHWESLKNIKLN